MNVTRPICTPTQPNTKLYIPCKIIQIKIQSHNIKVNKMVNNNKVINLKTYTSTFNRQVHIYIHIYRLETNKNTKIAKIRELSTQITRITYNIGEI